MGVVRKLAVCLGRQRAGSCGEHRQDRTVVRPSAALLASDESGFDELLHVM